MKIKNIFKWLGTIIQFVLIGFALIIYYLSDKKMGVMRSLTYRNSVWNNLNLRNWIIYTLIFILILFIIFAFIKYKKSNRILSSLICIVINAIVMVFAIVTNSESILAYYVLMLGAEIVLIIEFLKLNFLQVKK